MIYSHMPRFNLAQRVRVSVVSDRDQAIWLFIPTGVYREMNQHEVFFPAGKTIMITTTQDELQVLRQTVGIKVGVIHSAS